MRKNGSTKMSMQKRHEGAAYERVIFFSHFVQKKKKKPSIASSYNSLFNVPG